MSDNHQALPAAETEMERNRRVAVRAFEITAKQIEADALRMEESAIVGEHHLGQRHQLMDQARALRMTHSWLLGLINPPGAGDQQSNAA